MQRLARVLSHRLKAYPDECLPRDSKTYCWDLNEFISIQIQLIWMRTRSAGNPRTAAFLNYSAGSCMQCENVILMLSVDMASRSGLGSHARIRHST